MTAKQLRYILTNVPDDAMVWVYWDSGVRSSVDCVLSGYQPEDEYGEGEGNLVDGPPHGEFKDAKKDFPTFQEYINIGKRLTPMIKWPLRSR